MSAWSKKTLIDKYFKEAKRLNYVSRAAFKLLEIQQKHRLIQKGACVLDLGCSPGAWMQVTCQEIGPKRHGGIVLGVDIKELDMPVAHIDERVQFIQSDVRSLKPDDFSLYAPKGFDVVLSDMLHSTSGNAVLDVGVSLELTGMALHLAVGYYHDVYGQDYSQMHNEPRHSGILREGGHMAMKMFEGAGTNDFIKDAQKYFTKTSRMRPDAIRKASREFYLICKGRKRTR